MCIRDRPQAALSIERMKVLQILKQKTNASVGILMMPIIPYITDSYENIKAIYQLAYNIGLDYIVPGTMYLRGKTKPFFLNKIKGYDFSLYQKLALLYPKGSCSKEYKTQIYKKLYSIQKEYPL